MVLVKKIGSGGSFEGRPVGVLVSMGTASLFLRYFFTFVIPLKSPSSLIYRCPCPLPSPVIFSTYEV